MASLVYEPLAGDEFRLLTLLAGSDEPVRCTLRNVRLGEVSFHQEGIYLWKEKEAIEVKSEFSFNRLLTRSSRLFRGSGHKSDAVLTMGLSVVGAVSAGPRTLTITVTKGSDKKHRTHVGGGFYMAIRGGTDQSGDQEPIEWTKDQLPFVPEYEALSYTWGAPTPTAVIIVNDCAVTIRQNLYAALLQLRSESEDQDLWVDALCIDQLNPEERIMQVARMPSIYQRARHVIAWLGSATTTSPKSFELLEQLGQHKPPKKTRWYEYKEWHGPQFEFWKGVGSGLRREWYELENGTKHDRFKHLRWKKSQKPPKKIDSHGQRALQDLLIRPYWKRVWIIQELAYARSITLVCGSQSLDWSRFQVAITRDNCDQFPNSDDENHWFCNFLQESGIAFLQNNRGRARLPDRAFGFEARSATLLRTLESAWDFQSSDPRDKIYALLGLPSLDDDMGLPPLDYSKSVSHIFCTMAKAIIKYERALSILCLHHSSGEPHPLGLPSWTPDWTKRPEECPLLFEVFPSRPKYCAAGLTCVEGPIWEVFEDGRRIDIWAKSLGMGAVTQKDLFQARLLRKRLKPPARAIPSTREERAEEYDDRGWQLRGEFFGENDGLTTRRFGTLPISELGDPYQLIVDGFVVSSVVSNNRAVTLETVANGEWKIIIREWEGLDDKYHLTVDDRSGYFPPLAHFLWTIIKGHFGRMSDKSERNWLTVFYEKYLVWTGRLEINSATYRLIHDMVDDVETVLKRTVGWKFAISNEGHLAMVPARTREGDLICVLFGADVPIILRRRPQSTSESSYEFLGAAYVHQIMFGAALREFTNGCYHRSTFTIT